MLRVRDHRCPRGPADTLELPFGAVAQLAEHLHGMQGVVGSSPISSTVPFGAHPSWWRSVGFTLGGFVAGEVVHRGPRAFGGFLVTVHPA